MKPAKAQVKLTEIPFQTDLLDLHAAHPDRYPFVLESALTHARLGRYDILFAFPGESLRLDSDWRLHGSRGASDQGFLSSLDQLWSAGFRPERDATGLPFGGGWFVFLSYELAQEIEPSLNLDASQGVPLAVATRIPVAIIRDRLSKQAWIVAEDGREAEAETAAADIRCLETPQIGRHPVLASGLLEEAPARFVDAVETAKNHIAAGDIFQANLSREWTGELLPDVRPADLYRRLRLSNPAPFAGLAVYEDFAIVSSSPERLLHARGGRVETRPIAGTRPRNASDNEDQPRKTELLSHPKERAEHIMLIDLERNDLGRICRAGSVEVDEFMVVESYSHVHHIVSNVAGQLLDDATPGQMIRAVFPGGSITGCPKVRCMQIIHKLEARPRGAYTGAMGYINRNGSSDFNILIRTMTTAGGRLSFATGSGIVADSDPLQELEETCAKAKGLLLALDAASDE
jgi:anthranilate synthase component 1